MCSANSLGVDGSAAPGSSPRHSMTGQLSSPPSASKGWRARSPSAGASDTDPVTVRGSTKNEAHWRYGRGAGVERALSRNAKLPVVSPSSGAGRARTCCARGSSRLCRGRAARTCSSARRPVRSSPLPSVSCGLSAAEPFPRSSPANQSRCRGQRERHLASALRSSFKRTDRDLRPFNTRDRGD
jgi:hypothetical protein